jgi:hypothetical protein
VIIEKDEQEIDKDFMVLERREKENLKIPYPLNE